MAVDTSEAEFARLAQALQPYRADLVFVGGWAHRLHALHRLAGSLNFAPLMTRDADIATPLRVQPRAQDLRTLLIGAGFSEELLGEDKPPVTHYRLGGKGGLFVEFITDQPGGGYKRDGQRDDTILVSGVTAQKLQYVQLLTLEPWEIRLAGRGFAAAEGLTVRVANPATFIAQKILISTKRPPGSRAKDVLYVHDTLLRFARSLDELQACWNRVSSQLPPRTVKKLGSRRQAMFSETNDSLERAAALARGTGRPAPPDVQRILQACRLGLDRVFGPGVPAKNLAG